MNKLLYCAAALATLLFAGSCQKENLEPGQTTDGKVTFTVELPTGIQTKAAGIGDGTNVDQLIYEVWLTEDEAQTDLNTSATRLYQDKTVELKNEGGVRKATLELDLMSDQNFTILFWAQVKETGAYNTDNLTAVTYAKELDKYSSNDESLAAFYAAAYVRDCKHIGADGAPADPTVTLRRPFAQLNLGTLNTTTQYTVAVEKSDVKITNVPTVFNVSTKEVSVPQVISFQTANVPTNPTNITVQKKDYDYVAMNYVFAGDNAEVEYNIHTKVGGNVYAVVNNVVKNVPLKENHRTNIIGNLLTSKVDYQIVVDADFNTPDIDLESVTDGLVQVTPDLNSTSRMYEISSANGFAYAMMEIVDNMKDGDNYEFYLLNSIDLTGINYVAPTLEAGTVLLSTGAAPVTRAASEITITGLDSPIFAKVEAGAAVTFSDIVVEDHEASAALVEEVEDGAEVMIYNCEASDSADEEVDLIGTGADNVVDLESGVSTLEQLQAVLRTNATEIEVLSTIEIDTDETVVLDLNGKTVWQEKECTASYSMFANNGNLTVKGNGTIRFEDLSNGGGSEWGSYIVTNNGTLTIENGTLEHHGTAGNNFSTCIPIQNYAGKVVVNDGYISSPEFRSLRDFTAGGEIVINGGKFNGQVWMQGLGNGSSTLTINGGEFGPTANDGSSVFITNGTNDVKVSVTGGYFNTKIGCSDAAKEGVKGSITGGTFTTVAKENTNASLLAVGYTFYQDGEVWKVFSPEKNGISDAAELSLFAQMVNSGNNFKGKTVKLNADIDLDNVEWIEIGTPENNFSGIFDGDNHTVKNLNVVVTEGKEDKAYIGFFGYANNATIKNVIFENVNLNIACLDIDHSQGHIGAVAGSLEGTSTIENVTVMGDIFVEATTTANGASRVAVVAGGNSSGNVTMRNVHVKANKGSYLKANNNVGALAGQLQEKNVFENCSSNIDVTGTKFFAGGIIGLAAGDSKFTDCHTTGDITITAGREGNANDHYRVGGIAGGWADNTKTPCVLTNCSYTGKVSGTNADGSVAEPLDYRGYVGRGYTLSGRAGSKVTIDGVEYVQVDNAVYGIYTVDGVYEIASSAALKWFANKVKGGKDFKGETVVLTSDINLENQEWTPIGLNGKRFSGVFDGQNKTIRNYKISTADNGAQAALFGDVNSATLKNFTIDNAQILYPSDYEGDFYGSAVVSQAYYIMLENIKVQNSTIQGNNKVAAILAHDADGAAMVIANCHVDNCTIETKNEKDGGNAAGIVGSVNGSTNKKSLANCSVKNTTFNVVNSADAGKRSNAQMVATVIATAETVLTLSDCSLEGNTFNQSGVNTYKSPYDGVFVGGARTDITGKVIINGITYPKESTDETLN